MSTFSIVIPAYNQAALLQRAVESVLQQEGVSFEIIISDDSTQNDIQLYAEKLGDERVRYLRHQQTGAAVDNWNFGLQAATGDYLILMHHDEAMSGKDYLQRIQQQMGTGIDIVVSQIEVQCNGHQKTPVSQKLKKTVCQHPVWLFFINAIGPCACLTFRRSQCQTFDTKLHWFVDVEWYYRMLKGRSVVCLPTCKILSIHGHEGQITGSIDIMKTFQHDRTIIAEKHQDTSINMALWMYEHLILRTKKILGRI